MGAGVAPNVAMCGKGFAMVADRELAFDSHQFAYRRIRAVTKDSGIAFSDYQTMHREKGLKHIRRAVCIPPFALDNTKLQAVLKQLVWKYVHNSVKRLCPEGITLEELKRQANQRIATCAASSRDHLSEYQKHLITEHLRAVAKAGGYLELHASISWKAWRQGMNSIEIARETGLSPWNVRQRLSSMNKIARQLFPEAALPYNEHAGKMARAVKAKRGDPNPTFPPNRCEPRHYKNAQSLPRPVGCRRKRSANRWARSDRRYDPIEVRELRDHFGLTFKAIAELIRAPNEKVAFSVYRRNRLKEFQEHQNAQTITETN